MIDEFVASAARRVPWLASDAVFCRRVCGFASLAIAICVFQIAVAFGFGRPVRALFFVAALGASISVTLRRPGRRAIAWYLAFLGTCELVGAVYVYGWEGAPAAQSVAMILASAVFFLLARRAVLSLDPSTEQEQ